LGEKERNGQLDLGVKAGGVVVYEPVRESTWSRGRIDRRCARGRGEGKPLREQVPRGILKET